MLWLESLLNIHPWLAAHRTQHAAHCSAHRTQHTEHCSAHRTLHTTYCTPHAEHCTLHTAHRVQLSSTGRLIHCPPEEAAAGELRLRAARIDKIVEMCPELSRPRYVPTFWAADTWSVVLVVAIVGVLVA